MSNSYFRFKQFTVQQEKCAMKVGIDGVLLAAWASIENTSKILDIGTGTGLIALMLAQRCNASITAIDNDNQAVNQAIENVLNSPWLNRIVVFHKSLTEFANASTEQFDLIISNPPYFVNSTKAPNEKRSNARHTDSLSHEDLIEYSYKLLNPSGRICLILPSIEGQKCIEFAEKKGLYCSKMLNVFPKPNAAKKRVLLEFSTNKTERIETDLLIESDIRHQYSVEFSKLVTEFYLKL